LKKEQRYYIQKREIKMKKSTLICLLVAMVAVPASTVKAGGVLPAEWDFSLETHGSDATWTSSTNVLTGYPPYEYNWVLNYADFELSNFGWYSVMPYVPGDNLSGSGSGAGLPFVIFDESVGSAGEFTAYVYAGVGGGGYGFINMTSVSLGDFEHESITYDVTGFRCGGHLTVVPEPTTICLLGLGALSMLHKRKI
jgi:hypothetical protein